MTHIKLVQPICHNCMSDATLLSSITHESDVTHALYQTDNTYNKLKLVISIIIYVNGKLSE